MGGSVGVQAGRVCPGCGREDSIPLVYGTPGADLFEQAESGRVALGGCLMPEETAAFVCRSCDLAWGNESDPTADEATLAGLLDVGHAELVRALGAGWRREGVADGQDGVRWFVSGEPAQLAVGVQGPWFVLARPLMSWGEHRPGPLMGDGPRLTRDDVLHQPHLVAEVAEAIASHRRRSFRWCRTCRRATAPESFVASEGSCEGCVSAFADAGE
ncbi:hypothetical protein ABC795_11790 [Blastococcus sp. HT6-30]|uniref:hypothetical protein n=1 Tax=Blastococcus sp. HT6-30 TaxID=3144843 RepID=UPI0032192449